MTTYNTDSNATGTADGLSWLNAFLALSGFAAVDALGDTALLSHTHAETSATAVTAACAGTPANPTKIICVNTGTGAVATTAVITTTASAGYTLNGSCYVYGVNWVLGSGSSSAVTFQTCGVDKDFTMLEKCSIALASTNTASRIRFGYGAAAYNHRMVLKNVDFKFGNAGQYIFAPHCKVLWSGGSLLSGGTSPTALIGGNTDQLDITMEGINLVNASAGVNLCGTMSAGVGKVLFRNMKMPASWSGNPGTVTTAGIRLELHNAMSGATKIGLWVVDYYGSVKSEYTRVRTGGASDGTTPESWLMTASANTTYPAGVLESPEIVVRNTVVGSSKTVEVEVLHDSVTNLTDGQIWLEVQYLGTSGEVLGAFISDAKADVVATAADQTTSSAAWTTTGLTNPNKQKLGVTFTPQQAGYIHAKVVLALASKAVYVCPKLTVI